VEEHRLAGWDLHRVRASGCPRLPARQLTGSAARGFGACGQPGCPGCWPGLSITILRYVTMAFSKAAASRTSAPGAVDAEG
jgi:hypothetical protein